MPAPIVSWFTGDNTQPVSSWNIGTIDAGTISPDTQFLIWNNRGGSTAVSDMTNCTITTKDAAGNNTGELVTNKWIEVRVDSASETTFTPIGGTVTHPIQAGGGAGAGVISGAANDGTMANSAQNFAKVTLHANVPATASAGNTNFLTRVAYQYV